MLGKKSAEKQIAEKRVARTRDYMQVFSSKAGQRVLHDMMQTHFMLSSTFVSGNELLTKHHEGERNVVLRILAIMNTDPEQMQRMMEEIHRNA